MVGGVGGEPPSELLITGATGLLPCSEAEVGDGVGLGGVLGDVLGDGLGLGTTGTIVPRSTVTVAELAASAGPKFNARSETEFAFNVIRLLTPSEHLDTCTVYLFTEPLTELISQFAPVTVKSFAASPITASEKNNPKSKFNALVGEVGEVNVTVGSVRSVTTSVLIESVVGPATIPVIDPASRVSR